MHLFLGGRTDYTAQLRVKFRPAGTPTRTPAVFNADRTELTAPFADELLRDSDLRCMTWNTSGQAEWDPRLPGGGPSRMAPANGVWVSGQRPKLTMRLTGRRKQSTSEFFPAVRFGARCSLACDLRVRGRVATPSGKRVRGLRIDIDRRLAYGKRADISHLFTGSDSRRLRAALKQHRRLRVTLRATARDQDGRQRATRRTIVLRVS